MNRYRVVHTAEYEVLAENVAQAARVARKIRTIGERSGAYRLRNSKDATKYSISLVQQGCSLPLRQGPEE